MKIAFYNPTHITFMSGPETNLLDLLPLIVKAGHVVTLYMTCLGKTPSNNTYVENILGLSGVRIIELKSLRLPFSGSPIPVGFLWNFNEKYDFFYVFNGFAFQDILGLIVSRIYGSKLIYGVHAPMITNYFLHNLYQMTVAKFVIKYSSKVHVLSQDDFRFIKKINSDVFCVGNGIKNDFIVKEIPTERYNSEIFNVLFVGRLSDQKRILKLLDIIRKVSKDDSLHFYICGDGEYRSEVESLSSELSNLTYLGFVTHEKLPGIFKGKQVFLNLSKYETFCSTILEALATGLPVIATETNGISMDFGGEVFFSRLPQSFKDNDVIREIRRLKFIFENKKNEYTVLAEKSAEVAKQFTMENISNNFLCNLLDK